MPGAAGRGPSEARLHIVLVAPCIPQNTGNVGRLAAFADVRLHLVEPLGFSLDDRHLRRAGMDYWRSLDLHRHASWASFRPSGAAPRRLWLLTSHGPGSLWDADFAAGDGLVFGNEVCGAPAEVHRDIGARRSLAIPRHAPGLRSLNLATAVGIAVYEALRQQAGAAPRAA